MPLYTLEQDNRQALADRMHDDTMVVACLCAAWCDVCTNYRPGFEALAAQHPDKLFLWIDIEDQADLVGDFEVDNFPTLLIQRGDTVAFYGTTEPEARLAARLVESLAGSDHDDLRAMAGATAERRMWQHTVNLRKTLR